MSKYLLKIYFLFQVWFIFQKAPTDDAFNELKEKAPIWFDQMNKNLPVLSSIMAGHVLKGFLPASDIPNMFAVTSMSEEKIYFHTADKGLVNYITTRFWLLDL